MKIICTVIFLFAFLPVIAQYKNPKLQAYISPGITLVQLSNNDLIPPGKKHQTRIGDIFSCGVQFTSPLKNKRFVLSYGAGFSQQHYSFSKYSIGDFITYLFLFDAPNNIDTFKINYVRFTNDYFDVPLSASFTITKPKRNFQLAAGLSLRPGFLVYNNARIDFDYTYNNPSSEQITATKKDYTDNASSFVFTATPYFEASFNTNKNFGLLFRSNLPSFYATPPDKQLTTSTIELFSFTFGAFYSFK
ncbi:MAG: outer membrane beta-barrel protein [Bacteroidetes bacterium]|nr:outer membrane beta-barrel protein [Bacteroidota bacterium]